MPPFVPFSAAATPADPRAPTPPFQPTATPLPYFERHAGSALERNSVKLYVVPELSLRWIGVMSRSGRFVPGFSALILPSFQFVMSREKIPESTLPSRRMRLFRPGTLYGIDVPPRTHGIWTQLLHA